MNFLTMFVAAYGLILLGWHLTFYRHPREPHIQKQADSMRPVPVYPARKLDEAFTGVDIDSKSNVPMSSPPREERPDLGDRKVIPLITRKRAVPEDRND